MRALSRRMAACGTVLAIGALLSLLAGCAKSGDGTESPWRLIARPDALTGFAFRDADEGWGLRDFQPGVLHTVDGGRDWTMCHGRIVDDEVSTAAGLPATVADLALPAQVVVAGDTVFVTTFGPLSATFDLTSDYPAAAATAHSSVLASNDGGETWRAILSLGVPEESIVSFAVADSDHLWALCASSDPDSLGATYLLRSSDGGRHWRRLPGHDVTGSGRMQSALAFADARHGWSLYRRTEDGGAFAEMRETTNAGASWRQTDLPQGTWAECITVLDRSHLWVAGRGESAQGEFSGVVSASADSGRTWRRVGSFPDADVVDIIFVTVSRGWVVTSSADGGGAIYGTSDGGQQWRAELTSSASDWGDPLALRQAGDTLVAGNGFVLYSRAVQER